MNRGIYTATSGGMAAERRMEVVSNNLANVNTAGFKGQRIVARQQEFADTLASIIATTPKYAPSDQRDTPGVVEINAETNFTAGPIHYTGNPLDVALTEQDGFFAIQVGEETLYTKAGNFTLNANRELVTHDGYAVLGTNGTITFPADGRASISENGTVLSDTTRIDQLRIVNIADKSQMERTDGTRFRLLNDDDATELVEYRLTPGSIEMPNVSTVGSMVEMISTSRAFEAYTKIVHTLDDINTKVISTVRNGNG